MANSGKLKLAAIIIAMIVGWCGVLSARGEIFNNKNTEEHTNIRGEISAIHLEFKDELTDIKVNQALVLDATKRIEKKL